MASTYNLGYSFEYFAVLVRNGNWRFIDLVCVRAFIYAPLCTRKSTVLKIHYR